MSVHCTDVSLSASRCNYPDSSLPVSSLFFTYRQETTSAQCWPLGRIESRQRTHTRPSRYGMILFYEYLSLSILSSVKLSSVFLMSCCTHCHSYPFPPFSPSLKSLSLSSSLSPTPRYNTTHCAFLQELLKACPFRPAYYSVACIVLGQVRHSFPLSSLLQRHVTSRHAPTRLADVCVAASVCLSVYLCGCGEIGQQL